MSLKDFHVLFIVSSILLSFGLSWWAFDQYRQTDGAGFLFLMALSLLAAIGLICYEIKFIKKAKDEHF